MMCTDKCVYTYILYTKARVQGGSGLQIFLKNIVFYTQSRQIYLKVFFISISSHPGNIFSVHHNHTHPHFLL